LSPQTAGSGPTPKRSLLPKVAIFLLLTIAFTIGQAGVHRFRGHDTTRFVPYVDEEEHFMTGLMIHDYLLQGLPHNPLSFAKLYYLHYPKIAFGSWPPLLHMALAVWMIPFPATRASAIFYVDFAMSALVVAAILAARRRVHWSIALAVGIGVWWAPLMQRLDQFVGADIQYSLCSLACVYIFALYLERPQYSRAFWFGVALLAAVATKNNGLFLGISVPVMILVTRSLGILRRRDIWLAIIPSVIFVGIWQYVTLPFNIGNMKGVTEESVPGLVLFFFLKQLIGLVWVGLLPLILWSIYARIVRPLLRREPVNTVDAATFALLIGPVLFHSMLPHDANQRYLLPSVAALLLFSGQALLDLFSLQVFARVPQPLKLAAIAVLLVVSRSSVRFTPPVPSGYNQLATELLARYPAKDNPSILISASYEGEGMLVSEIATHEPRMGHWLIRGSKIFRHRTGIHNNREMELTKESPEEMIRYFEELPVSLLVLADDGDPEHAPQHEIVAKMIKDHPDRWTQVMTGNVGSKCQIEIAPCTIEVYRFNSTLGKKEFSPDKLPTGMSLWKGL